jgi:hypothetical protein
LRADAGTGARIEDDEWLLRRIVPRGMEKMTGAVKPIGFNLRVTQQERTLSLYRESGCDPAALLSRAPAGFGVARVRTAHLRALGWTVRLEPDPADHELGHLHVAAAPPELDSDGQIPLQIREAVAARAEWVIEPS